MSKQILIATIGSLGDLHPCLALAHELKQRGHSVTIASTEYYRSRVETLGASFHPMRPAWNPTDPAIIRQCEDLKRGPEVLYRKLLLPVLRDTYDDLAAAATGADLMLAGELVFAAPLVAEKLQLAWVSMILSPYSFFSCHEPSVTVTYPSLLHLRKAGVRAYRAGLNLGRLATRHWSNPVRDLRRQLGLRTAKCDPVFRDKYSPNLVLAPFSRLLARPQPDWPPQTLQPGFFFPPTAQEQPPELAAFLASGDPPIVFTQGSTAVHHPGQFYQVSLAAAVRLGRRAILLGTDPISNADPTQVLTVRYAPYSHVFPHAAVNVHQGGSGTIGEALRAGRPMLVVPFGWDQPDNASRIQRLGVGFHLPRTKYNVDTATRSLTQLLTDRRFSLRADEVQRAMLEEHGVSTASDAIEDVLRRRVDSAIPGAKT